VTRRTLPVFAGDDVGMRPTYRGEIAESLAMGTAPWTVAAATALAFDRLGEDLAAADHGGGDPPACRAGCSTCCHQRVDVTAPEVLALAEWIAAEKSAPELEALRARVLAARDTLHGLDAHAHWTRHITCPLLEADGTCGSYVARPLACRRAHSTSIRACETAFVRGTDDVIPSNPSYLENYRLATIGYFEGFAAQDRPLATYELAAALNVALVDVEAACKEWGQGRDPFAAALTHDADEIERSFGGRLVPG
jgi:Fe-S-cluster containining protein